METSQKRNWVLGALAVGIAGYAGYRLVYQSSAKPALPHTYQFDGVCVACKAEARRTESMRVPPPLVCAKCGKQAVYPWLFCDDCHYRFVPNLEKRPGAPPAMPMVPVCIHCGSTHTAAWLPEDPAEKPAGDALPQMP